MVYLSSKSLSTIDLDLLFIQPYRESKINFSVCIDSNLSRGERASHLLMGLVLLVPVINTLALLLLRSLQAPKINKNSSFNDNPFAFWPFDKPLPKLLTDRPSNALPIDIHELTNIFMEEIFNCLSDREEKTNSEFEIHLDLDNQLNIKYQNCLIELSSVLENVDWEKLEDRWKNFLKDDIIKFFQKSLIFESIDNKDLDTIFSKNCPFIRLYTSNGFYSWLNPLLRQGKLTEGLLPHATKETNQLLKKKHNETINQVAKELLFISMLTAANLGALPDKYKAKERVIRIAHIPKDILKEIRQSPVILERGFLSASGPGGGFAGGGPCDEESYRVKFIIHSKNGRYVKEFSDLPENEVLFRPFTKFSVLKCWGDENGGYKVELEEYIGVDEPN